MVDVLKTVILKGCLFLKNVNKKKNIGIKNVFFQPTEKKTSLVSYCFLNYKTRFVITCLFCAACRGSLLCSQRLTDERQSLGDGTQVGVLRGVFPRAVQGAVHVPVPTTRCSRGCLWKHNLLREQVFTPSNCYLLISLKTFG